MGLAGPLEQTLVAAVGRGGLTRHLIQNPPPPPLSRLPIPISHILSQFLPRMPTNLHSHELIGTTLIASTCGRLDHLWKHTTLKGGRNIAYCHMYHIEATPPPSSCTPINCIGTCSVSAPVPLPGNAIPPRTSLLPPPWRTSLLPNAATLDNRHTPRYSLLPHVHVASSLGATPSASLPPSTVPVNRDGQYGSRWSLLPDIPPAKYRSFRIAIMSHIRGQNGTLLRSGLCRAQPTRKP